MDKVIISVIMPVYNPGIYLEECLESVFAQTFADFELICVDDASKDDLTLKILESYQDRYDNMKVLHLKQNVGAGEARNRGFKEAVGEYVIFLDSDDVYAKELLERMYSKCVETDADVCICGFIRFDSQDEKREPIYEWKPDILKNEKRENYLCLWAKVPYNKLCKKSFLLEHGIYFQSLSSGNDVFFSLMIAKTAIKKAFILDTRLIKSRKNIPMQISANRDSRNLVHAVSLMRETMKQRNQFDDILHKQLVTFLIFGGFDQIKQCSNENINRECYYLMQQYLRENIVTADHKVLHTLHCNIMERSYESRWYEPGIDFLWELRLYSDEIKKNVENKKFFLWGLGKRGEAFQQFCKEEGIDIFGVTDRKNLNVRCCTEFGNKIFSKDDVVNSAEIIIASNENIYNELVEMELRADILNLEKYCPI